MPAATASNRRPVPGRDLPSVPTGLASLALRALGGPNGNGAGRPIGPLGRQDMYRLRELQRFLASAARGTKPLRAHAESRQALAATPQAGRGARYPTMSQDRAAARLVQNLLRSNDPAAVEELANRFDVLLQDLGTGANQLAPTTLSFLNNQLKPFLYRLARADDRRRYQRGANRRILRS